MRELSDDDVLEGGNIRREVRREQRYNILIKDKFEYVNKKISWIKVLLTIVTMTVVFDIAMDMFRLW